MEGGIGGVVRGVGGLNYVFVFVLRFAFFKSAIALGLCTLRLMN